MHSAVTLDAPQHMRALGRANEVRCAAADVKQELKSGSITFAEALDDERAGSLTVLGLLRAQNRWGRQRALRAISAAVWRDTPGVERDPVPVFIAESRRVRDLTARQRAALISAVTGSTHAS